MRVAKLMEIHGYDLGDVTRNADSARHAIELVLQ